MEVYKGNKENLDEATAIYLEDYAKYIYEGPEAEMRPATGKCLKYMAMSATASAAGMDQWCPGDFRLLSDLSFEHLTEFFNFVEETGSWPKDLTHCGAAFLAKEEVDSLDPLGFRVLLMLPAIYRLWARTRLSH